MTTTQELSALFTHFRANPGAEASAVAEALSAAGLVTPPDYPDILCYANGGEGWVGEHYLRLYPAESLPVLNEAYQVARFAPGLVVFGSTGGGEAYAFDTRKAPVEIVQLPFIPLDFKLARPMGTTFLEFLGALAGARTNGKVPPEINLETFGKEFHELKPSFFGGDPADPQNKVIVELELHAELCVFWNGAYQRTLNRN